MVGRVAPGRAMSFAELEAAGVEGLLIAPDDRSREAMGANHFDPSRRGPAAVAGCQQGRQIAAEVGGLWERSV